MTIETETWQHRNMQMDRNEIKAALEAVLFTTGKAESTADLAKALETDRDIIIEAIHELSDAYLREG